MRASEEDEKIELWAIILVPILTVLLALSLAFGSSTAALLGWGEPEIAADLSEIEFQPPFDEAPVSSEVRDDGLVIQDYVEGAGDPVEPGDMVAMHYTGYLLDGTVFDSSVARNRPITLPVGVGRVIPGWDMGVPGMQVGGKRLLVIPPELAYGDRARGKIPANATLVFTLELLAIRGK